MTGDRWPTRSDRRARPNELSPAKAVHPVRIHAVVDSAVCTVGVHRSSWHPHIPRCSSFWANVWSWYVFCQFTRCGVHTARPATVEKRPIPGLEAEISTLPSCLRRCRGDPGDGCNCGVPSLGVALSCGLAPSNEQWQSAVDRRLYVRHDS